MLDNREVYLQRSEIIKSAWKRYDELVQNPNIFFKKGINISLHPHQLESLKRRLIDHEANDPDTYKFTVTSIIGTWLWKWLENALFAKILNVPFVFVSYSLPILDSAMEEFKMVFDESELGRVDSKKKEYWKFGIFTTFDAFKSNKFKFETFSENNTNRPKAIFLDERDYFQSDLSDDTRFAIRTLYPDILFNWSSATENVNNRSLANSDTIAFRYPLYRWIQDWRAAHIIWVPVNTWITITREKLKKSQMWTELQFNQLLSSEQYQHVRTFADAYFYNHFHNWVWEKWLIYCGSILEAEAIAEELRWRSVLADCVSWNPWNYKKHFDSLRHWDSHVKTWVDILQRWVNVPNLQFWAFTQMTTKPTKLEQFTWRLTRFHPKIKFVTLYQAVSTDVRTQFSYVLLPDIFWNQDMIINDSWWNPWMSLEEAKQVLQDQIWKNRMIIWWFGPPLKPIVNSKFVPITSQELSFKMLETKKWTSEENIIWEKFFELMADFFDKWKITNIDKISTTCISSQIKASAETPVWTKSYTWHYFINIVLRKIIWVNNTKALDATNLWVVWIRVIKLWYKNGTAPTSEEVMQMIEWKDWFLKSVINERFDDFVDLFMTKWDNLKSFEDLATSNPKSSSEVKIEHNWEVIIMKWGKFLSYFLAYYSWIKLYDTYSYLSLSIELIKKRKRWERIVLEDIKNQITELDSRFTKIPMKERSVFCNENFSFVMGMFEMKFHSNNPKEDFINNCPHKLSISCSYNWKKIKIDWISWVISCIWSKLWENHSYNEVSRNKEFMHLIISTWHKNWEVSEQFVQDEFAKIQEKKEKRQNSEKEKQIAFKLDFKNVIDSILNWNNIDDFSSILFSSKINWRKQVKFSFLWKNYHWSHEKFLSTCLNLCLDDPITTEKANNIKSISIVVIKKWYLDNKIPDNGFVLWLIKEKEAKKQKTKKESPKEIKAISNYLINNFPSFITDNCSNNNITLDLLLNKLSSTGDYFIFTFEQKEYKWSYKKLWWFVLSLFIKLSAAEKLWFIEIKRLIIKKWTEEWIKPEDVNIKTLIDAQREKTTTSSHHNYLKIEDIEVKSYLKWNPRSIIMDVASSLNISVHEYLDSHFIKWWNIKFTINWKNYDWTISRFIKNYLIALWVNLQFVKHPYSLWRSIILYLIMNELDNISEEKLMEQITLCQTVIFGATKEFVRNHFSKNLPSVIQGSIDWNSTTLSKFCMNLIYLEKIDFSINWKKYGWWSRKFCEVCIDACVKNASSDISQSDIVKVWRKVIEMWCAPWWKKPNVQDIEKFKNDWKEDVKLTESWITAKSAEDFELFQWDFSTHFVWIINSNLLRTSMTIHDYAYKLFWPRWENIIINWVTFRWPRVTLAKKFFELVWFENTDWINNTIAVWRKIFLYCYNTNKKPDKNLVNKWIIESGGRNPLWFENQIKNRISLLFQNEGDIEKELYIIINQTFVHYNKQIPLILLNYIWKLIRERNTKSWFSDMFKKSLCDNFIALSQISWFKEKISFPDTDKLLESIPKPDTSPQVNNGLSMTELEELEHKKRIRDQNRAIARNEWNLSKAQLKELQTKKKKKKRVVWDMWWWGHRKSKWNFWKLPDAVEN